MRSKRADRYIARCVSRTGSVQPRETIRIAVELAEEAARTLAADCMCQCFCNDRREDHKGCEQKETCARRNGYLARYDGTYKEWMKEHLKKLWVIAKDREMECANCSIDEYVKSWGY